VSEVNSPVAALEFFIVNQALAILGPALSSILQPEHLAKGTSDSSALQSNLGVIHAVNIPHQHVHSGVVPAIRHGQHVVKGSRASEQGHEPPECASTKMGSAYTFILSGTRDLDHGHTRPYIDQEVRVHIRSGLGKLHRFGIGIAVSEHLVGNFGDEEIETWLHEENTRLE
jgi:hypothetical protein